jgi:uncharacterized protein (DUF58 family)
MTNQDAHIKNTTPPIRISTSGNFLPLVIISIVIFLFTTLYVLQVLILFFLLIITTSKIYSEILLRSIIVKRTETFIRVYRYEWARVELTIENLSPLTAFMLCIQDNPGRISVFRDTRKIFTLGKKRGQSFAWEGHCEYRGEYPLGEVTVRLRDPLGIYPVTLKFAFDTTILVYPALAVFEKNAAGGTPLGNELTNNKLFEDMTRQRSLRPYQSGDEKRRINWKVSARYMNINSGGKQNLMVNEYEETRTFPLTVFLNLDRDTYDAAKREIYLERAIEAASAVCQYAVKGKQDAGIIIYQKTCTTVIPAASYTLLPILETLARVKISDNADSTGTDIEASANPQQQLIAEILLRGKQLAFGSRFVYIGPPPLEENYAALAILKQRNISCEYLVLDKRLLSRTVRGPFSRYLLKEAGYELL